MLKENNPRYEKAKAEGRTDELCIPFCDLLNRIGLKTDYCCQGHPFDPGQGESKELFYILFDKNLPDGDVYTFLQMLDEVSQATADPRLRYPNGFFYKRHWTDHGRISSVWVYKIDAADESIKRDIIQSELDRFRQAENLYLARKVDRFRQAENLYLTRQV